MSPPSDGPAHDGKVVGKEAVTYVYEQVSTLLGRCGGFARSKETFTKLCVTRLCPFLRTSLPSRPVTSCTAPSTRSQAKIGVVGYGPSPSSLRRRTGSSVRTQHGMLLVAPVSPGLSHWGFRFLAKEEEIVPPYRFKVYDLLVLPPSFPYGGMVRSRRIYFRKPS